METQPSSAFIMTCHRTCADATAGGRFICPAPEQCVVSDEGNPEFLFPNEPCEICPLPWEVASLGPGPGGLSCSTTGPPRDVAAWACTR